MKKLVLVLVLAALVAGGAFAQFQMSVGGGGIFDMSLNNGYKVTLGAYESGQTYNNVSFGGFVFFDITYAEIEVDYLYGSMDYFDKDGNKIGGYAGTFNQIGLGLLGKYPIDLGALTLFPLIGINYNMVMTYTRGSIDYKNIVGVDGYVYSISKYYSQFGILAGIGFDIGITEQIFIRAEALFHLRLPAKETNIYKDYAEKYTPSADFTTLPGIGPRIKIGVGYKL